MGTSSTMSDPSGRPLPDDLAPEVAYLVLRLRELKDRTRLSLAALAAKTTASKSSWDRYLNGRAQPPRQLVAELAQLAGEPVDPLLALWDTADACYRGRGAAAPISADAAPRQTAPASAAELRPAHRRGRALGLTIAVVTAAAAASAVHLLRESASPPTAAPTSGYTVACRSMQCTGASAYASGCAVAVTRDTSLSLGTIRLDLIISDQCQAGWATIHGAAVGDQVRITHQDGGSQSITVPIEAGTTYLSTPMLGLRRHSDLRACVRHESLPEECTAWGVDRPGSTPQPALSPTSGK